MKQKIVFFGSGWYTIPVIKKLLPHGLELVITTEKNPESPFLKFCNESNIKTLSVSSASEIINQFAISSGNRKSQIENHSLAILASFGAIIPDEIINTFENGILNIHPSLLPKYKGPSPIQYQLLNGETTVGVTIIKLDNEVDHGPILLEKPYNLQGNETSKDLLSILFEQGGEMIEELIVKLENGEKLIETPQDHSQESWSYKIEKKDGLLDMNNVPDKTKLDNMIKAYFPWPSVWFKTKINGQEKIVKLLPENRIQVEGKNPMTYKDFMNGYEEGKNLLAKLGMI